jgi:hypothetical protein
LAQAIGHPLEVEVRLPLLRYGEIFIQNIGGEDTPLIACHGHQDRGRQTPQDVFPRIDFAPLFLLLASVGPELPRQHQRGTGVVGSRGFGEELVAVSLQRINVI